MSQKRKLPLLLTKCLMIFTLICNQEGVIAKEGMWIPATIKSREKDMKETGLQIPVELLYNENGTGINNSVVLFGKGCTGEIISGSGLLLTNHHCGYGSAQRLSSEKKDFFANGFWAQNLQEELPCPGLTVTFIRKMENVTNRVLEGINEMDNDASRDTLIAKKITALEKEYAASTHLDAQIKPYFTGNQYWVAITETFKDIRLVGFPPNGVGAFGGDDENWMWPRHTGDFSLFRVYAGADNKPAEAAAANKPYQTNQFLSLNIGGYKEGDFSMVYGFPGTTMEYISSFELNQVYNINDPISIQARTKKLDVWTRHMTQNRETFIKYTAKRAGVANGWKKWQGEVLGLKVNNVIKKKQDFETSFQKWADGSSAPQYASFLLRKMNTNASSIDDFMKRDQYVKECLLAIELIQQGAEIDKLLSLMRLNISADALSDTIKKAADGLAGFYKNYDAPTDKDVFITLMSLYFITNANTLPPKFQAQYLDHKQDMKAWAEDLFKNSILTSADKIKEFAAKAKANDSSILLADPAYQLFADLKTYRAENITPRLKEYTTNMRYLNRLYMHSQMAMDSKRSFYPDANLTQRITYGNIKGLDPDGPAKYSFQTKLGDAIALEDSTSENFKVPAKLKHLYKTKDFGRWAVNGDVPLAFVAMNHTSGGNSGSPTLNSKGQLIGTNFDRAYEGTMSDYYFDPNRCRNISVDIRYTLFIIEKLGGAGWLLNEMKLVRK